MRISLISRRNTGRRDMTVICYTSPPHRILMGIRSSMRANCRVYLEGLHHRRSARTSNPRPPRADDEPTGTCQVGSCPNAPPEGRQSRAFITQEGMKMSNRYGDATGKARGHDDVGARRTPRAGTLAEAAVSAPRIIGPRSGIELVNLFDPKTRVNEHPLSGELRKWATEYLCEPHEELGRSGPVCPFTGPSIAQRHFWAGFIDGTDIDRDRMTAVVDDLSEIFPDLPPATGADSALKAI